MQYKFKNRPPSYEQVFHKTYLIQRTLIETLLENVKISKERSAVGEFILSLEVDGIFLADNTNQLFRTAVEEEISKVFNRYFVLDIDIGGTSHLKKKLEEKFDNEFGE